MSASAACVNPPLLLCVTPIHPAVATPKSPTPDPHSSFSSFACCLLPPFISLASTQGPCLRFLTPAAPSQSPTSPGKPTPAMLLAFPRSQPTPHLQHQPHAASPAFLPTPSSPCLSPITCSSPHNTSPQRSRRISLVLSLLPQHLCPEQQTLTPQQPLPCCFQPSLRCTQQQLQSPTPRPEPSSRQPLATLRKPTHVPLQRMYTFLLSNGSHAQQYLKHLSEFGVLKCKFTNMLFGIIIILNKGS